MSSIENDLIRQFAKVAATAVAEQAIAALMKCTDTLSGDDSGLENTWEEICAQVQGEESFFWDAYRQIMNHAVLAELETLPGRDLAALWLQTDEGWDWHCDFEQSDTSDGYRSGETPTIPYEPDDISNLIVQDHLLSMAETYSNKNIRTNLGGGSSEYEDEDDEEEDQGDDQDDEELRERLVALMPRDSMLMDLWNWDIHFEELSFDDLTEVAFEDGDELAHYAGVLADDFLRWINEYDMDYGEERSSSPKIFAACIKEECLDFMTKWRANVRKEFGR